MSNYSEGPKCPECEVRGIEYIVSEDSREKHKGGDIAWFDVVFCEECGHVYGVFTKTVVTLDGDDEE